MAESSSSGPRRHNRANWVALRTLRQLPKVIGETSAGEPIVEIRSVRLVLRDGAAHFSRVTTCSKCGREVPGAPVLNPGDLDHPPHPVICKDCVRTASAPVLSTRSPPVDREPEAGGSAEEAGRGDDGRVAALERQVAELAELVKGQRADLEAALQGRVEETRVEVRSFAAKELARAQEDVDRMMKAVVERAERTVSGDGGEASAVEAKLTRTIERLAQQVDARRSELVADLEGRLAGLQASVEDHAGPGSAEIQALKAELDRTGDDLRRRIEAVAVPPPSDDTAARLDAVETQLRELHAGFEGRAAQAESGLDERLERLAEQAAPERERMARVEAQVPELQARFGAQGARLEAVEARLAEEAARLDAQRVEEAESAAAAAERVEALDERVRQLDERLDRQAERLNRTAAADPRLDALEKHLDDAVGRVTALVDSQRLELQEDLRRGLDEVRAALAAVEKGNDSRLRNLETAAAQRAAQLEDLVELQTALDTGLGELRSEIQQIRDTATRAASLETVEMPQLPTVEMERGRRGGRKALDAVAGLSAALQDVLSVQRQLRAEVMTLGNESETAVRASARASAQAAAVGPLRQDVRGLRDEVAAQNQAVAALTERVESLRRAVKPKPAAKPAAKPAGAVLAPKATKATKATSSAKGTRVAKATPAARATKATKKA